MSYTSMSQEEIAEQLEKFIDNNKSELIWFFTGKEFEK